MLGNECVALALDGSAQKYRPYLSGNEFATTAAGNITPVFVFNFKSGKWAAEMHNKMLIYADQITGIEGMFSRQLCPLFAPTDNWTGFINFAIAPKAILTEGTN
jgi:hypothetical protein